MSPERRAAFRAIVIEDLPIEEAAVRLGLSEDETLRHFVQAFRIHAATIDAPGWP
jgi:DNA-directed RNA polymerase specialized sigma24 family protein